MLKNIENENDDDKIKMETKVELSNVIVPTKTKKHYESKTTEKSDTFLMKRDRGAANTLFSRSLSLEKMSASQKMIALNQHNKSAAEARQSNSDIQDIISGIVKLLNGNVNVHANNQGGRIQINNRINNRGPPKIAEAQLPFSDIHEGNHDVNKIISSQSYPYDRPEGPSRPFLTGVPLPEQIVPSMQQNKRPGFISQNRPPWKRPKPRPSLNRRPYPTINRPIPAQFNENENTKIEFDTDKTQENIQYIEKNKLVTLNDSDPYELPYNATTLSSITTIIQSTSEINAVIDDDDDDDDDKYLEIEKNDTETIKKSPLLESSINENFVYHQSTTTQTPSLESQKQYKTSIIESSITSAVSRTNLKSSSSTYFPRLGVVLGLYYENRSFCSV